MYVGIPAFEFQWPFWQPDAQLVVQLLGHMIPQVSLSACSLVQSQLPPAQPPG
jgi:hypothetical protein